MGRSQRGIERAAKPPGTPAGEGANLPTPPTADQAPPPAPEAAQRTSVFRQAGLLRPGQAAKLARRFAELGLQPYTNNPEVDYGSDGEWVHVTRYLHQGGAFRRGFPMLRRAVLDLAARANKSLSWGLDLSHAAIRCAEYHHYRPGGSLPERDHSDTGSRHYDKGSLVTVDVMLEAPEAGGGFQTAEPGGELKEHEFREGDALVFVSHKYHCVAPVRRGERRVLVCELWAGEERECGHRCELPGGACDFASD